MKKVCLLSFAVVVAALLFSCSKAETEPETAAADTAQEEAATSGLVKMTFTATADPATKSAFEDNTVKWEAGDEIGVYDGSALRKFTVTAVASDGSATAEGEVASGASEFYAVSPYSAASSTLPTSEGVISFTLPAEQVAGTGNVDTGALVSLAHSSSSTLTFSNAVSLIKITVADDDIASIKLTGFGSETFAGNATAEAGVAAASADGSSVTLKPSGAAFAAGETYCISILPATFSSGFRFTFTGADGDLEYVQTSNEATFAINNVRTVNTSGAVRLPFLIKNKTDMDNFLANTGQYSSSDEVKIASDIDMDSEAITSAARDFNGTLDGQGHKVYNFTVSSTAARRASFIANLQGTLKDIVFGSSDGTSWDGVSSITYTGTAGAYAGLVSDLTGTMSGIRSFVSVTNSGNASQIRVGGLVGCIEGSGKISGSEFAGTITMNDDTSTSTTYNQAGGVAGRCHANIPSGTTSVSSCTFSGTIVCDDSHTDEVGGIVGNLQAGIVTGCASSGTITIKNGNNSIAFNVGGAVGRIEFVTGYSVAGKITDTEFSGNMTLGCPSSSTAADFVGGVVGRIDSKVPSDWVAVSGCTFSGTLTCNDARSQGIGGILGQLWGGSVSDCISKGVVNVNDGFSGYANYGGVAGYVQYGSGTISGCNNSTVLNVASDCLDILHAGGIVGIYRSGALTISGNTNTAAITVPTPNSPSGESGNVGGIIGYVWEGAPTVTGNTNSGAITNNASNTNKSAGGIVGATVVALALSNNTNTGAITCTTTSSAAFAGGILGGMIHKNDASGSPVAVSFSGDKSTGDIKATNNPGAIFGAAQSTAYYTITIDGCAIGGTVGGKAVTETNKETRNILYGYYNASTSSLTVTDLTVE